MGDCCHVKTSHHLLLLGYLINDVMLVTERVLTFRECARATDTVFYFPIIGAATWWSQSGSCTIRVGQTQTSKVDITLMFVTK